MQNQSQQLDDTVRFVSQRQRLLDKEDDRDESSKNKFRDFLPNIENVDEFQLNQNIKNSRQASDSYFNERAAQLKKQSSLLSNQSQLPQKISPRHRSHSSKDHRKSTSQNNSNFRNSISNNNSSQAKHILSTLSPFKNNSNEKNEYNVRLSQRSKQHISPRQSIEQKSNEDQLILQAQDLMRRKSEYTKSRDFYFGRPQLQIGMEQTQMQHNPIVSVGFFSNSQSPNFRPISQNEMENMRTPHSHLDVRFGSPNKSRHISPLSGFDRSSLMPSQEDNTRVNVSDSKLLSNNSQSKDHTMNHEEDSQNSGNKHSNELKVQQTSQALRKTRKTFGFRNYFNQIKDKITTKQSADVKIQEDEKYEHSSISSSELDQENNQKKEKTNNKKTAKIKPQKSISKEKFNQNQEQSSKKKQVLKSDFMTADFNILNNKKIVRLNKKSWIIYPENLYKQRWDLFIALLLTATCCLTPYNLAFQSEDEDETLKWTIIESVIDFFFFFDTIFNFFTSYYDDEYSLIDDRKVIVKGYLSGWFTLDLLSIIPFDQLFQTGSINRLARIARIGKLYKLVRMTKIARILKIVKERKKLVKYFNEIIKIGLGFERLLFLMIIFLVLCHIVACLWIFVANFDDSKRNWVFQNNYQDLPNFNLYIISYYFTVTTIVTVGYGDITAQNTGERIIAIFLMIIGVISFSFASGSLSSLISNYDSSQAKLKEKIATLNDIREQHKIGPELFDELRKAIKYDHSKNHKDKIQFMEELPQKLKIELAMEIHKDIYHNIDFFKHQDKDFIFWVGPLLKHMQVSEQEYIFKEGDEIKEIYFLVNGHAAYVLPRFDDTIYIQIERGNHFGVIDLVYDEDLVDYKISLRRKSQKPVEIYRIFTVLALVDCELLILTIQDLNKMKTEFPEQFDMLFSNSLKILKKAMKLKDEAIQSMELEQQLKKDRQNQTSGDLQITDNDGRKPPSSSDDSKDSNPLSTSALSNITKGSSKILNAISKNFMSLKKIDEELEVHEDDQNNANNNNSNQVDPQSDADHQSNIDHQNLESQHVSDFARDNDNSSQSEQSTSMPKLPIFSKFRSEQNILKNSHRLQDNSNHKPDDSQENRSCLTTTEKQNKKKQNNEDKQFMSKFKSNFGKFFQSSYTAPNEDGNQSQQQSPNRSQNQMQELNARIGNLEKMFEKMMASIDQINKKLDAQNSTPS
eukprot:403336321